MKPSEPADPFTPFQLFATPLFATVVANHEQHRQGLLDEIDEFRRKTPGLARSNRAGWHSGPEFLASRNEHVAWLLSTVLSYARRALAPYYSGFSSVELKFGHYWANVLPTGAWNAPHHHHPQHWSGVYYVSVPTRPSAAALSEGQADQSGMIEFLNPNILQSQWGSGSFVYGPREGLTLLFPSHIVHLVHPHTHADDRVSIAYNFNVIPKPVERVGTAR